MIDSSEIDKYKIKILYYQPKEKLCINLIEINIISLNGKDCKLIHNSFDLVMY